MNNKERWIKLIDQFYPGLQFVEDPHPHRSYHDNMFQGDIAGWFSRDTWGFAVWKDREDGYTVQLRGVKLDMREDRQRAFLATAKIMGLIE